jgi:signal transduction histidine kinase
MKSERVTLAQELHDGIAQELVALGFSIDAVISKYPAADNKSEIRAIRFKITDLIEKVRRDIHELRSGDDLSQSLADTDVSFELNQIAREIVRNIEKHSQATQLTMSFSDNGIGGAVEKTGSFGILGIQERVEKLNGVIAIESDHHGTRIVATIPLKNLAKSDKNESSSDHR